MSPHQLFLMRCRTGKLIRQCELADYVYIFNKIVDYVGAKFQSEKEATKMSVSFSELLKDFWPNKYMKEVIGAYFLAVKGHLLDTENNVIKVLPMIDIRTCSDFVQAFDRHFNKAFEVEMKSQRFWYTDPQDSTPSQEQIDQSLRNGLAQALEVVKNGQKYEVAGTDLFLFAELKQRGLIELTDEQVDTELQAALKVYKYQANLERYDKHTSLGRKADLAKMVENILPTDVRVKNIARRKILNDYLQSWVFEELDVEGVLGG